MKYIVCILVTLLSINQLFAAEDFFSLVESGRPEQIREALNAGAEVNARHSPIDQETPLMHAARFNSVATLEVLVRAGANLEAQDQLGWTALNWAIQADKLTNVIFLIQAGAHYQPDKNSRTSSLKELLQIIFHLKTEEDIQSPEAQAALQLQLSQLEASKVQIQKELKQSTELKLQLEMQIQDLQVKVKHLQTGSDDVTAVKPARPLAEGTQALPMPRLIPKFELSADFGLVPVFDSQLSAPLWTWNLNLQSVTNESSKEKTLHFHAFIAGVEAQWVAWNYLNGFSDEATHHPFYLSFRLGSSAGAWLDDTTFVFADAMVGIALELGTFDVGLGLERVLTSDLTPYVRAGIRIQKFFFDNTPSIQDNLLVAGCSFSLGLRYSLPF